MTIFVGSSNPVKINAATLAASEQWPDVKVSGFDVPSLISAQPKTDDETKQGSINRARGALAKGLETHKSVSFDQNEQIVAIGMEGGVFTNSQGELWSTVWVTVIDTQGNSSSVNGARFKVPQPIAELIFSGEEMGHAVANIIGSDDKNSIKQNKGMIGIITQGFVDRTEEYTGITKLAMGLWFGRDWQEKIS
ncbi:MAG: DUF84 family protein [Patescibacteria group bacterium]